MPVTSYHTLDGRLRGESSGGARADYLSDALGSVTGTADASGSLGNAYRHKPYGHPLARSGAAPDPLFLWTGETGSRYTGASGAEQFNRARHYATGPAVWGAVDPLWPAEPAYRYAGGNPTTRTDPSGMIKEPCSLPKNQIGCDAKTSPGFCDYSDTAHKKQIEDRVYSRAVSTFLSCFTEDEVRTLAEAAICISKRESNFNPCCNTPATNRRAFGLFQLGRDQWHECATRRCRKSYPMCGLSSIDCHVEAAVNLIIDRCRKRDSVYDSMYSLFEVARWGDFATCLADGGESLEKLKSIKCNFKCRGCSSCASL